MHCWKTVITLKALLFLISVSASAAELKDATGASVRILDQPQRIVTLAPSLGELAADLLGDQLARIVAVSEYTDYPPALSKKPSIGPYAQFNLEKVAALKPDLVLATADGNPRDQVLHLREIGIPVLVVKTETLADVQESMLVVGKALGKDQEASQMVQQFKTGLEHFRARAKGHPKKKVLLELDSEPLVVVGRTSFLHELIELIGATNLYGSSSAHYPKVSIEDAVARNPDAVVVLAMGGNFQPFYQMAAKWTAFPQVAAVKNHRIKVLKGDAIVRPTLRLLEGLSLLEMAVYGES